ncbi:hypothetical protein [Lichenifustis flavocetrariae]|uniref:Uncharacterized protein n=1 Tax=Lichenifustis flavocetrariae TaxID=2949735 RepID=A0AA41Z962_9HYPH|nr:hypothetical protein [Lichenifustis flavocetrariae]MCW6512803.1 hypothetical protein [Lichenifustis flavocetrariae]
MPSSLDRLNEAFERLLGAVADPGQITLTAVRQAAGVSNAQLHRLPAFKAAFLRRKAEAAAALPVAKTSAAGRERTKRDMQRTIDAMANLIQIQSLGIAELTRRNARLIDEASSGKVVHIDRDKIANRSAPKGRAQRPPAASPRGRR